MPIWKAAVFGALQGIAALLPVSSSGHIALAGHLLKETTAGSLSFFALLHLGTLVAIVWSFRVDVFRLCSSLVRVLRDLVLDLPVLFGNLSQPSKGKYRSGTGGNYRRWLLLMLTSLIPMPVIALLMRRFSALGASNLLITAMGFFVTALLLLVSSFTVGSKKDPRRTRFRDALMIGAFQGVSSLPGISRLGMTLSAAGLSGFTRSYMVRYGYLLAVPSILGSLCLLLPSSGPGELAGIGAAACFVGVLTSSVVSLLVIRVAKRFLVRHSNRGFAIYSLLIGIVSIVVYFH